MRTIAFTILAASVCAGADSDLLRDIEGLLRNSQHSSSELGISEEEAASASSIAREFRTKSEVIVSAMHRVILDRRLATAAGGQVEGTESQLVAATEQLIDQLARDQMEQLRSEFGPSRLEQVRAAIAAIKEAEAAARPMAVKR